MGPLQAAGLAVATALASMVNFTLLMVFLKKHLGTLPGQVLFRSLQKMGLAGLSMAVACITLREVMPSLEGLGVLLELTGFVGELGLGTVVYLGVAAFLGCEEVRLLRGLFQRR